jgi:hypothetical protein
VMPRISRMLVVILAPASLPGGAGRMTDAAAVGT